MFGSIFGAKDRSLVDFWVPAGSQNWQFWAPCAFHFFKDFCHFSKKRPDQSLEAPGASQGLSRDLQGTLRSTHRHHFGSFFSQKIKLCFHSFVSIEFHFFSGCQKLSFSGDQTIIQEINPSHLIYTFICISVCIYSNVCARAGLKGSKDLWRF